MHPAREKPTSYSSGAGTEKLSGFTEKYEKAFSEREVKISTGRVSHVHCRGEIEKLTNLTARRKRWILKEERQNPTDTFARHPHSRSNWDPPTSFSGKRFYDSWPAAYRLCQSRSTKILEERKKVKNRCTLSVHPVYTGHWLERNGAADCERDFDSPDQSIQTTRIRLSSARDDACERTVGDYYGHCGID